MNKEQKKLFYLRNKEAIKSIKKRAFKRGALIFAGSNLLFFLILNSDFLSTLLVTLPFSFIFGFVTYINSKRFALHDQFPSKFEPLEYQSLSHQNNTEFSTKINNSNSSTSNPYDPRSSSYWSLNYTDSSRDK